MLGIGQVAIGLHWQQEQEDVPAAALWYLDIVYGFIPLYLIWCFVN